MAETTAAPKAAPKKETVTVEAIKRSGFPGFYMLGRLFPSGSPVEVEVTVDDIYKTRKVTDPVTDEVTDERYLFKQSELKQLLAHSAFLKIFRSNQSQMGGEAPVKAGSPEHIEINKKAIQLSDKEARGEENERGPSGAKR